jgi:hypothetical protein
MVLFYKKLEQRKEDRLPEAGSEKRETFIDCLF